MKGLLFCWFMEIGVWCFSVLFNCVRFLVVDGLFLFLLRLLLFVGVCSLMILIVFFVMVFEIFGWKFFESGEE